MFTDGKVNFVWQPWKRKSTVDDLIDVQDELPDEPTRATYRMYNKLPESQAISNKKTFFTHLQKHFINKGIDPWKALPVSFHVTSIDGSDQEYSKFLEAYDQLGEYWIIKPGENSNCGQGIEVAKDV